MLKEAKELIDVIFGDVDSEVIYTGNKWEHMPGLLTGGRAARSTAALYTNLCTFKELDSEGVLSRVDPNVAYMYAVMLDDIGTKHDEPALAPTAILESSPGNFQWIYALTEPCGLEEAQEFMARMKARSVPLGDAGSMTANRLFRLPLGVNGKKGTAGCAFKVSLVSLVRTYWTLEELATQWALPEYTASMGTSGGGGTGRTPIWSASEYARVRDPLFEWLLERGDVLGDGEDWVSITCPWADTHTDGEKSAGYSPVGRGSSPDFRAFHCFHEHCHEKKTGTFLAWVHEHDGPSCPIFDPVATLVSRYLLLEYSSEVADTWANAGAIYPIVSLAAFRSANREYLLGDRGGKQYYGEMWLESSGTVRCKGRVYQPSHALAVVDVEGVPYFNTYRPISWPVPSGSVSDSETLIEPFVSHLSWLIPSAVEHSVFLMWLAAKLQRPDLRSYAMCLVADLAEGETGVKYGTGRSMMGDIISAVFQSGVASVELGDIIGSGDSQSAYNDWADGTQLVICEETKAEVGSWRDDHASYEKLKKVIDAKPTRGIRVKPKYGKIYKADLYCNYLFFTNHSDAFQLPADRGGDDDERRFGVLTCAKGRRSKEEYAALYDMLEDPLALAALYHWFMDMDVSGFDRIYPPKTPAKSEMQKQSANSLDDIWEAAMEALPGAVCTKNQLRDACICAMDDEQMGGKVAGMVSARWRKMVELKPRHIVIVGDRQVRPRVLRDHPRMRQALNEGDVELFREEISQNGVL